MDINPLLLLRRYYTALFCYKISYKISYIFVKTFFPNTRQSYFYRFNIIYIYIRRSNEILVEKRLRCIDATCPIFSSSALIRGESKKRSSLGVRLTSYTRFHAYFNEMDGKWIKVVVAIPTLRGEPFFFLPRFRRIVSRSCFNAERTASRMPYTKNEEIVGREHREMRFAFLLFLLLFIPRLGWI